MLSSVAVKNYQSLGNVSLELKPFTVIVGPSSSGKSAFTRALKCLTSNQRGDSFITHGETQTVITARTDRGTVALLRGKKNEYVLIPEGDAEQQKTFTKLAGTTPEEVSQFIGIPSGDPLNYSNQFDMPYLLKSSAQEVARTLGELTNVSVIFEASREANRLKLQASSKLKTRTSDYADLTENLDRFRTLKDDLAKLEAAEALLREAFERQTRIDTLSSLLAALDNIPDVPEAKKLPDVSAVEKRQFDLAVLGSLIEEIENSYSAYITAEQMIDELQQRRTQSEEEYSELLKELGTCPTCGQSTEHAHT